MYQTIGKSQFIDTFAGFEKTSGRFSQMGGYEGVSALYDYLEQYEEDTGEEIESDVIALCCDFTQYDSFEDVQKAYDGLDTLDDLKDQTTVIEYGEGKLIVANF